MSDACLMSVCLVVMTAGIVWFWLAMGARRSRWNRRQWERMGRQSRTTWEDIERMLK